MGWATEKTTEDGGELAETLDIDPAQEESDVRWLRKGAILGGAYRVQRRLGQGGMGTVYLVEHTDLNKRFAAKVVSRALSESAIKRLLNEARITSAIDHPNIVDVVNLGRQEDGSVFVIMELLRGEDLGRRLERRLDDEAVPDWLPDEELMAYVPQILDGLAAAHDHGIIHRDLKPDNVFLARKEDGRVSIKLLDFGIAKNVEPEADHHLTRTGQIIGTPLYMAPEQARNMSDADVRADIYSVGVILYEMATGAPPFEADTLFDLIVQHATEEPVEPRERRPELPKPVESVILRCLEKDRNDRFATVRELQAAWGAAWRGVEPPPLERSQRREIPNALSLAGGSSSGRMLRSDPAFVAQTAPRRRFGPSRAAILVFLTAFLLLGGGIGAWMLLGMPTQPAPAPDPVVEATTSPPRNPGVGETEEATEPPPESTGAMVTRIFQTEPQGATVTHEGRVLGTTPLNLSVPEGGVLTVTVALRGYQTASVDVRGDGTDRREFTLARRGSHRRDRRRRAAAEPAPRPAEAPRTPSPDQAPRQTRPEPSQRRPSGQILLGMDQFEAEQRR